MSEQKHTPGTWILGGTDRGYMTVESGDDLSVIARVGPWTSGPHGNIDERDANARLIAAAPELYEALVMVRDADNDCHADGLPTIPASARRAIDEAIAKATGANQ